MKIKITLDTENDAFAGEPGTEVARILRELARNLTTRKMETAERYALSDANGNRVGTFETEGK